MGKEKGQLESWPHPLDSLGRGERIRTSDHVHPMHVRYQAALRPDLGDNYNRGTQDD
jgi:hypothetical protein